MAGFVIVALAALWGLGALPLERIAEEVASIETGVASLVEVFGPNDNDRAGAEASPTPQAVARLDTPTESPTTRPTRTPTETAVALPTKEVTATAALAAETAVVTPTLELTSTLTAIPTETPTATPTPTTTPTATATATPTVEPTATPTVAPTNTLAPTGRVIYKVKSGDTLSSIAEQYGITWQDLASANGLTSRSTLRAGQELVVPVAGSTAPTPAPAAATTTYTVKSGDSLSSIASRYGLTWQQLAQANGLTGASRLNVGQKLIIPAR